MKKLLLLALLSANACAMDGTWMFPVPESFNYDTLTLILPDRGRIYYEASCTFWDESASAPNSAVAYCTDVGGDVIGTGYVTAHGSTFTMGVIGSHMEMWPEEGNCVLVNRNIVPGSYVQYAIECSADYVFRGTFDD